MKKMISVLFMVVLMVVISPLDAFALTKDQYFRVESKNVSYGTLNEALSNASDTDTIVVTSNMVLDKSVVIDKNITIESDFETVNVTRNFKGNSAAIVVDNGASLTLKDISIDGNGKTSGVDKGGLISVSNGGKLVLDNQSMLSGSSLASDNTYGGAVYVDLYGCLIDNGCSFSNNSAAEGPNTYWVPATKTNTVVDLVRMKKCIASDMRNEQSFVQHFSDYNFKADLILDDADLGLIVEGLLGN